MKFLCFAMMAIFLLACGDSGSRAVNPVSGQPGLGDGGEDGNGPDEPSTFDPAVLADFNVYDGKIRSLEVKNRLESMVQKDDLTNDFVKIDNNGFSLYSSGFNISSGKPDLSIKAGIETPPSPSYEFIKTDHLKGLKIALDPKYIGGINAMELEKRYVKATIADKDIFFTEADINFYVAQIVKKRLEEVGVEVLLTREYLHKPVYEKNFKKFKVEDFPKIVDEIVAPIANKDEKELKKNALLMSGDEVIYRDYFVPRDELERVRMINEFEPHLTIRISMNMEGGIDSVSKKSVMTDKNQALMFIPGGMKKSDLLFADNRIKLLDYLLTPVLDYSRSMGIQIGSNLAQSSSAHVELVDQTKLVEDDPLLFNYKVVNDLANERPVQGMFSYYSNYFKYLKGPVVEFRPLTQNNKDEVEKLMKGLREAQDYFYNLSILKDKSNRIWQIAEGYFFGVILYFGNL